MSFIQKITIVRHLGPDGIAYEGTLKPYPYFNVEKDVVEIENASSNSNDENVVGILSKRTADQRVEIFENYETKYNKILTDAISQNMNWDLKKLVLLSLRSMRSVDAFCIRQAFTDNQEKSVIEILISRSNEEIAEINKLYEKEFKEELRKDILHFVNPGFYQQVLLELCKGEREVLSPEKAVQMITGNFDQLYETVDCTIEAQRIYDELNKCLSQDETTLLDVFCKKNPYQLYLIIQQFEKISGIALIESIKNKTKGEIRFCLKAIVKNVMNRPLYFAVRLKKCTEGLGTKDDALMRHLITQSELDMKQILKEYESKYKVTLKEDVKDDTSGLYQTFLLNLIDNEEKTEN